MFDFEKNAVVESVDTVPEKYRGLYGEITEGDNAGKFGVTPAAKPLVEDYLGQTKALNSARGDKKKASDESAQRRQELTAFRSIMEELDIDEESRTADGLKAKITELFDSAKSGKELKVNLDKVKAEYEKKQTEALAAKDGEIAGMTKALQKHLIGDVATREIAKANGSVALLKGVVEKHCKVVKDGEDFVVRVVDAQGDFRTDGAGGWMGVDALVTELKANEDYGQAFKSEQKPGVGTKPGSTSQRAPLPGKDKTAKDKIAAGLTRRGITT